MTKSELIEKLSAKHSRIPSADIEKGVKLILEHMSETLMHNDRIEIRGFGSFSLRYREPKVGRNPKTGEAVNLQGKYTAHFKPGKLLRENINESRHKYKLN